MIELITIIAVLLGIVFFLIYEFYMYSRRPRMEAMPRNRESVESKLSDLRSGVVDLRMKLKEREMLFDKAFKEVVHG
jgi:hypothetical protein